MLKENFVEFIEKSIKSNWTIHALADYKGISFTYAEVAMRVARLHIAMELAGIGKGDKVALIGKNSAAWAITYIATVTYGAVIVPILPDFTIEDVHHIVNHSDSKVLFAGDGFFDARDIDQMPNLNAVFSLTDFSPVFIRKGRVPESIAEDVDDFI